MADNPDKQSKPAFNWESFNASIGRDVQSNAGNALRADAYKDSVGFVLTRRGGDATTGGTGFFVDKDGLMATDYHVVQDEKNGISVKTADGQWHKAKIVNVDTSHDLALLQVEKTPGQNFIPVDLAPSSSGLKGNDAVTSRGYPHRSAESIQSNGAGNQFLPLGTWNVNEGLLPGESPNRKMILSQMDVQKGDSGSPLIRKSDGKVIGIVDFSVDDKNQTVSTPIEDLQALIAKTRGITAATATQPQFRVDGLNPNKQPEPLYTGATAAPVTPYQFKWPAVNFAPTGSVATEFKWRPVGQ